MQKILTYPVIGRISSKFGFRKDPVTGKDSGHNGIDIAVPSGTEVKAPADGKVSAVYYHELGGNSMTIEHANGYKTGYAHLRDMPAFKKGDVVKKGDTIAFVGNTGSHTTGAHLHFTVRKDGVLVDPLKHIA